MTHSSGYTWHTKQSYIDWNDCSIERYHNNNAVVLKWRGKTPNDVLFFIDGDDLGLSHDTPEKVCIDRAIPIFHAVVAMRNRAAEAAYLRGRAEKMDEIKQALDL